MEEGNNMPETNGEIVKTNGEIVRVPFVVPRPCDLVTAERAERLIRPSDNYWLVKVEPVESPPTVEWVATYEWYDDDTTAMML